MFIIPEATLAGDLGVPRILLRKWRSRLKRGEDWEVIDGAVHLSEKAAAKIRAEVTAPKQEEKETFWETPPGPLAPGNVAPSLPLPAEANPSPETPEEPLEPEADPLLNGHVPDGWERLIVMRANVPNPSMIMASAPGSEADPRVWRKVKVQSNRLYKPGMAIAVQHVYGEVWKCVGNPDLPIPSKGPRNPRFPGRW